MYRCINCHFMQTTQANNASKRRFNPMIHGVLPLSVLFSGKSYLLIQRHNFSVDYNLLPTAVSLKIRGNRPIGLVCQRYRRAKHSDSQH